jgi:hypothetical protein
VVAQEKEETQVWEAGIGGLVTSRLHVGIIAHRIAIGYAILLQSGLPIDVYSEPVGQFNQVAYLQEDRCA